jgi:hypothetical protein
VAGDGEAGVSFDAAERRLELLVREPLDAPVY